MAGRLARHCSEAPRPLQHAAWLRSLALPQLFPQRLQTPHPTSLQLPRVHLEITDQHIGAGGVGDGPRGGALLHHRAAAAQEPVRLAASLQGRQGRQGLWRRCELGTLEASWAQAQHAAGGMHWQAGQGRLRTHPASVHADCGDEGLRLAEGALRLTILQAAGEQHAREELALRRLESQHARPLAQMARRLRHRTRSGCEHTSHCSRRLQPTSWGELSHTWVRSSSQTAPAPREGGV